MSLLNAFFPDFTEKYIGGLPNFKGPAKVQLIFSETELIIKTEVLIMQKKVTLRPEQIGEIRLGQNKYRSAGKAVTGGIIGGILTGGIGLLAGAAMGGKRRTENNLSFDATIDGKTYQVLFEPSRSTQKLYNRLISFVAQAPQVQPTPQTDVLLQQENLLQRDVTSEIEKLYNLLQKGILTQEEFDEQK